MRSLIVTLFLVLISTSATPAEPAGESFAQRGYLDTGSLLSGERQDWEAAIDGLQVLGFTYVATAGEGPSVEVAAYLESKGIAVRPVTLQTESGSSKSGLYVIGPELQKSWAFTAPELPKGTALLWSDNGAGEIALWPMDPKGFEIGVLVHAGGKLHGPVQDPYPSRIGESLANAAERGLAGNVLVAAPDTVLFSLNIEAAAAAMNAPGAFDGEEFHTAWASRRFGDEAAADVVKSMDLFHRAHDKASGFTEVAEASNAILKKLQAGTTENANLDPIKDALRIAGVSLSTAERAAGKVPADRAESFKRQVTAPVTLFIQNLELLESLSRLSGAWKVYRALPTAPSRQRVAGMIPIAVNKAVTLESSLQKLPSGLKIQVPSPADIEALTKKLEED